MQSDQNGLYAELPLRDIMSLEYGDNLPEETRSGQGFPVLGSNGIVGYHVDARVRGPGIVVGRKGSIGKVTWVDTDFWRIDTTYYVQQQTEHSRRWLFYLLGSLCLERLNSATGIPGLNRDDVYTLNAPIPNPTESVGIARTLQSVDDSIERTRAVIDQTRKLKTALLQNLLTNGLPGRHKKYVDDKKVGRYPADWNLVSLDDLIDDGRPICYGILMPGRGHPGGVPVVKVKDIRGGVIDESDILLTTPELDEEYRRSRLRAGDLLMTIRGTTGRVAMVPPSLDQANITQDTARLSVSDKVTCDFIYYALQGHALQQLVQHHTIGQAVKGINIEEVRKLSIPLPEGSEREQIAELFHRVEERLASDSSFLNRLEVTKAALSQALLTGRVRVPTKGGE